VPAGIISHLALFSTRKSDIRLESNPKAAPTKHVGAATKHRAELEQMREDDPEFFEFLQTHDKDLLEFGGGDEEEASEVWSCFLPHLAMSHVSDVVAG
jgi:hypothetical protein